MTAPLRARLRDYRMLWRAAVAHADPRLSTITRWGTSTLAVIACVAVFFAEGARAALTLAWCMASILLLLSWVWRFLPGAVKLAAPAYAQLVPRMRQRVVELSWLVCCIGIAGLATAPYKDAGELGIWLCWVMVLLLGSALGVAGHRAGGAFIMAACFGSLLFSKMPAWLSGTLSHPLAVLLSLPVYAAVILVAVRAMFPQAGEAHWDMLARRARWVSAAGKSDPFVEQVAGKQARGWYAASLRGASARRDGRRLVMHALGPGAHLGDFVVALAYMTAIVVAIGTLATWRADRIVLDGSAWMFASMLLVVPLIHCVRIGQLSGDLAAEQALVRLAPAMPAAAAAFNRQLGRALLLQALTVWGLSTGTVVLLAALSGAGWGAQLSMASLACLVLPAVAAPLRDHAGTRNSAAAAAATLLLVSLVEGLGLGMAAYSFAGIPVLPVAGLVSIVFTIVVVVRGLRTMRRAPCAFPAGRMD